MKYLDRNNVFALLYLYLVPVYKKGPHRKEFEIYFLKFYIFFFSSGLLNCVKF